MLLGLPAGLDDAELVMGAGETTCSSRVGEVGAVVAGVEWCDSDNGEWEESAVESGLGRVLRGMSLAGDDAGVGVLDSLGADNWDINESTFFMTCQWSA